MLQDYNREGNEETRSCQSASNRGDLDFTNLVESELLVSQNEDMISIETRLKVLSYLPVSLMTNWIILVMWERKRKERKSYQEVNSKLQNEVVWLIMQLLMIDLVILKLAQRITSRDK